MGNTTSVHWHGLDVPNGMDGVPCVEPSPKIEPGHYFDYTFQITNPPGTHMYHSHYETIIQELTGLCGAFIIEDPTEYRFGCDYLTLIRSINTIAVASGTTYDIEFAANNPGVWPLHCHMPHHTSNNFTKQTGGMFTTVKYVGETPKGS
ncbi:multicopper oxidase domain-containing protein [Paenibacillus sp. 2TAB19]|uniref:multicopper oxidase domain-containing protein n=1 Tax=Paenibacillus sp. 2TAB19 TaxID=3233003 RepID=UPI003F987661